MPEIARRLRCPDRVLDLFLHQLTSPSDAGHQTCRLVAQQVESIGSFQSACSCAFN